MRGATGQAGRQYDHALALAWSGLSGYGVLLRRMKEVGVEAVWTASRTTLTEWGATPRALRALDDIRVRFDVGEARAALKRSGQRFVPFGSPMYPEELRHLSNPPAGLFVLGSRQVTDDLLVRPRMTVVGTRRASAEGVRAAEGFVKALSMRGIAVVSGMALGIDGHAHGAALESCGLTAAVMGCGADVVYPARHRWLYAKILQHGAVISELPPGSQPTKWAFPRRNRLLAALSDAVLVVEGSNTSGALQTARWALELGRTVYAVPGSIFRESSEGCNSLISDGATPALRPEVLVEDFLGATRMERGGRLGPAPARVAVGEEAQLPGVDGGDTPSGLVFKALKDGPASVDRLVEVTGLAVREVGAALGELEIQGRVGRIGPGMFLRAP